MAETCGDNRFEIINAAKSRLIESTNIEDRPEEMAVIDSVLFRMWQMGWLPGQERKSHLLLTSYDDCHGEQHYYIGCSACDQFLSQTDDYDDYGEDCGVLFCYNCGCFIDRRFIEDYVSGEVVWMAGDGDLGDLSDPSNWRGENVVG